MGMFDSLYADRNHTGYDDEWQTKAYWCELDSYFIGDEMPLVKPYELDDYQVEVSGERLATVRAGRLVAVPADRDVTLPLLNYSGHLTEHAGRCSTCDGVGLVDWEPFAQPDSEDDQQPCPDCPDGWAEARLIGREVTR